MRIFLTGGAGFVGSHTADHLVARGLDVRIFDDLSTGSLENLRHLEEREQFVRGDILDPQALVDAMKGCDAVVHLAAVVSEASAVERAAHAHAVNTTGTLNVLEAARRLGIRRVVLASSASVYGDIPAPTMREQAPPRIATPYAGQKWLGEVYAETYARHHGLSPVCLRYFHVYGPRRQAASPYAESLSRLLDDAAAGRVATLRGDGQETRDYVYVQDVATANCLALLAPDHLAARVINVGTGRVVTDREAYERILALVGVSTPGAPRREPARPEHGTRACADLRRAREVLGFTPRVDLSEGLAQTLGWCRKQAGAAYAQVLIRHRAA